MKRLLIIKPSSLGDIVHALPTVSAVRSAFPAAEIHWLVKEQWSGLLDRVEGLAKVWSVRSRIGGWLSIVPELRNAAFDCVIDLQGLFRSGAMAWLTGCRRRIGFDNGREASPLFYTQRVSVPTPDMHAIDRYLLVATALTGTASAASAPAFGLRSRPEDHQAVRTLLQQHGLSADERWIAVNPSARWPTKRWPVESFAKAADRLQSEGLGRIVVIGGSEDRSIAHRLAGLMRRPPVDLTGAISVRLLPALLESAAALLTNDSGPMHVAAAVGTPVVAIFGPTSPVRTGPYGSRHLVLQQKVPCSPCFSRRCRNAITMQCLVEVLPEQAVEAVKRQVK